MQNSTQATNEKKSSFLECDIERERERDMLLPFLSFQFRSNTNCYFSFSSPSSLSRWKSQFRNLFYFILGRNFFSASLHAIIRENSRIFGSIVSFYSACECVNFDSHFQFISKRNETIEILVCGSL